MFLDSFEDRMQHYCQDMLSRTNSDDATNLRLGIQEITKLYIMALTSARCYCDSNATRPPEVEHSDRLKLI